MNANDMIADHLRQQLSSRKDAALRQIDALIEVAQSAKHDLERGQRGGMVASSLVQAAALAADQLAEYDRASGAVEALSLLIDAKRGQS